MLHIIAIFNSVSWENWHAHVFLDQSPKRLTFYSLLCSIFCFSACYYFTSEKDALGQEVKRLVSSCDSSDPVAVTRNKVKRFYIPYRKNRGVRCFIHQLSGCIWSSGFIIKNIPAWCHLPGKCPFILFITDFCHNQVHAGDHILLFKLGGVKDGSTPGACWEIHRKRLLGVWWPFVGASRHGQQTRNPSPNKLPPFGNILKFSSSGGGKLSYRSLLTACVYTVLT